MINDFLASFWQLLNISGFWLVVSYLLCSVLHIVLRPEFLQRNLGNTRLSSLVKATISGMLLPICSCGVVPLALSLYHSGAFLGPTLAFLVATPIINPAAVILAFVLLGPQLTAIYIITGFLLPMIIGVLGNKFGKDELISPVAVAMANAAAGSAPINSAAVKIPWSKKIAGGLDWGVRSLGLQVSRYVLVGLVLAALLLTIIPVSFIQDYLSRPDMISLLGIAALGAIMYVCAVGHIPFIAALVAAGAAPGAAIAFLLTGTATNLPELFSILKLIGKRTIVIYTGTVVFCSFVIGYITSYLLMPGFTPVFDLSGTQNSIALANKLSLTMPVGVEYICSVIILAMGIIAWRPVVKEWFMKLGRRTVNA
ncbi:MAG: permease [Syntrophomonadaceae bacterium]|nr:permease [Syntrophomonadaceae bacterium]